MKNSDALKIAGIVAASIGAYLVVTRTLKAGGNIVAAVKTVVTEDLNPSSGKNVVTQALQSTDTGMKLHIWLGDKLGAIFGPPMASDVSDITKQAPALTGAGADAIRATEREKLRQMEGAYKNYNNPLANVTTLEFNPTTQENIWP